MNKRILLWGFTFFLSGLVNHNASAERHFIPELETVSPENIFAPVSFDDNDNAQVIVSGVLPTTCYKAGPADVTVDKDNFKIFITQKNFVTHGAWCAEIITPYMKEIDLGMLPIGKYEVFNIQVNGQQEKRAVLPIADAVTPETDNFHYAQVQEITVDPSNGETPAMLLLKGKFTSDCIHLQEVRVFYRQPNVIEVLPITDLKEGAICKPDSKPFTAKQPLNPPWKGKTLIHVRSMSGQALNKVFEF
jgi:hypothetical protein